MRYSSAIFDFCGDLDGDGEGSGELSRRCSFVFILANVLQPRSKPDDVVVIAAVGVMILYGMQLAIDP